MEKTTLILAGLAAAAILGGIAFLAVVDIPVQRAQIEKTIPNDRFFASGQPVAAPASAPAAVAPVAEQPAAAPQPDITAPAAAE